MNDPALDVLLLGLTEPKDREITTRAFYQIAHGDPKSSSVVFAVLLKAAALSIAESAKVFKEGADNAGEGFKFNLESSAEWASMVATQLEKISPHYEDNRKCCEELAAHAKRISGQTYLPPPPPVVKLSLLPFVVTGLVTTIATLGGLWLMVYR